MMQQYCCYQEQHAHKKYLILGGQVKSTLVAYDKYTRYDIQCDLLFKITQCYKCQLCIFIFNQPWSNWLFGHYSTLTFLLCKKQYIDSKKIYKYVTPNNTSHEISCFVQLYACCLQRGYTSLYRGIEMGPGKITSSFNWAPPLSRLLH